MEKDGVGRALCVVPQDDIDNLTLDAWKEAANTLPLGAGKFIPMITKCFAINKLRCLEVVLATLWLVASLILPMGYSHGEYRRIKARVKRTTVVIGEVAYRTAGQKIRSTDPIRETLLADPSRGLLMVLRRARRL